MDGDAHGQQQQLPNNMRSTDNLLFVTVTHPRQMKTRGTISQVRSHVRGSRRATSRAQTLRNYSAITTQNMPTTTIVPQTQDLVSSAQNNNRPPTALRPNWAALDPFERIEQGLQSITSNLFIADNFSVVSTPHRIGSPIDPFGVLPAFTNENIDVRKLAWIELRYHSIPGAEFVQSDEHIESAISSGPGWLSALAIASPIRDVLEGVNGESETTMLVRSEALSMINERLRTDPLTNEVTWMLIRLVVWEALSANYEVLQTHLQGLEAVIARRGGLYQISDPDAALALTIEALFAASVHEQAPKQMYLDFAFSDCLPSVARRNPSTVPCSPVHRLSNIPLQLPGCWVPPATFKILSHVRILTQLLLERSAAHRIAGDQEPDSPLMLHDGQAKQLYEDILNPPPAQEGTSTGPTNDWIYEACRLSALIFSTAIMHNIPISAALHHHNVISRTPHPISSLGNALRISDSHGFWGGGTLFGPLLWVALVGSVAPDPVTAWQEENKEDYIARKRCRFVLSRSKVHSWVAGTMDETMDAVRTFLKVQGVLAKGKGMQKI